MTGIHTFRQIISLMVAGLLIGAMAFLGIRSLQSSRAVSDGSVAVLSESQAATPPSTSAVQPQSAPDQAAAKPTFVATAAAGTYAVGSTVSVSIRINSPEVPITTVQPVLTYPADKLQFISIVEGDTFKTTQRTQVTNGRVDLIRGITGGSAPIKGDHLIATVTFKVVSNSGVTLAFSNGSAAYDNSGTGSNILDLAGSKGATITAPTAANR